MVAIEVEKPAVAMAKALDLLFPQPRRLAGISALASLGDRVTVEDGAAVGPFASVGDDSTVGAGTEIQAGVVVGQRVRIGRDCRIHPRVVIEDDTEVGNRVVLHAGVVLGADGFGFVVDQDGAGEAFHRKLQQLGRVVVEDDVEIGANSAVDRAAFGETRIGRGTKIDNLVTIGHNCRLGRHCIVVGQAGISGSTTLGDYVTLAGQAGLTGHLTIGDRAIVGAQAGVTKDVPAGAVVLGSPAVDARRAKRALSILDTLPEMRARIVALERAVAAAGLTVSAPGDGHE
jgi:UDP-3-O-[3-hydroxymyristoyl] glucosamine N-acyltransferase